MEKTTRTNDSAKESIAFCEWLFTRVCGRAQARINGHIAGYDRARNEIFVKSEFCETIWMPAGAFLQHLTAHEIHGLRDLPGWDGGNEWQLTGAVLGAAEKAIRRFRAATIHSSTDPSSGDYYPEAPAFTERLEAGRVVRHPIHGHQ